MEMINAILVSGMISRLHTGILVLECTKHGLGGKLLTHGAIKMGEAGITVMVSNFLSTHVYTYT